MLKGKPSSARAKGPWQTGTKLFQVSPERLAEAKNEVPYFPEIHVWRWIQVPLGIWVFPSIDQPPADDMELEFLFIGRDHDGFDIFMVAKGEHIGKTVRMCETMAGFDDARSFPAKWTH